MSIKKWFDVDRNQNMYVLTVRHTTNKKGESVETIQQVNHLGMVDNWNISMEFKSYPLWPRAIESGDFAKLCKIY